MSRRTRRSSGNDEVRKSDYRLPDGDRIAGSLYLPEDRNASLPVMIVGHGWGGDRRLDPFRQELGTRLVSRSMAIITLDFYGCGETGGPYAEMTYGRWVENLADVYRWATTQPWADPARIGCLGISSGSTAALRFAREHGAAFVISIATCLGLYISMPNSPARTFVREAEGLLRGGRAGVFGISFPLEFFRDFIGHAPVYHVDEIACPVFFLQGVKDNPFRRSDAWLGYQLRRDRDAPVRYLEIADGDHGLNSAPEESVDAILAWLETIDAL
jgi:dipeptidyl aminopeptidase/acylaminoacyl peptidase